MSRIPIIALIALAPIITMAEESRRTTWKAFWANASEQNLKIRALKAKTEAVRSEIVQGLPAPMIGLSSMGMNGPTSGLMEKTFEVSQKIPFPTKFLKAGAVKDARVAVASSDEKIELQKIEIEASDLFIGLYQNLKSQELFSENQGVLARHLKRLQSLTLSDQIQKIHILEIEAEVKSIDSEVKDLQFKEKELRRRIAVLLNEDGSFLGKPAVEELAPPRQVQIPKRLSLSESARKREELAVTEASYAKQEWLPDLTLTYRRRNRLDGIMPSSQEVMIGIEVPFLWGWQPSAKNRTASALSEQARYSAIENQREVTSEIEILHDRVRISWERIQLFRNEILPIQEKRVHLVHRISASDMESLDAHRTTLEKWFIDRIKLLEIESEYRRASATLEILLKPITSEAS